MSKLINLAIRGFIEIFFCSIILSALISILCVWDILPDGSQELVIGLYAAVIIFVIVSIVKFRDSYCELQNYGIYLIVNFSAYSLFVLVSLFIYKFFSSAVYTWMFAITKVGRYTNFRLTTSRSAMFFHFIVIVALFLAPIGLGWIKEKRREREEFISRMPGMLEVNPLKQKSDDADAAKDENEKEKITLS